MQLPDVKRRQVSQSVRGTASQTLRCDVSFLDEILYVRQARSALATVHRRRYNFIPLLPMPSARDIWIVDAAKGCPVQRKACFRPKNAGLLGLLVSYYR